MNPFHDGMPEIPACPHCGHSGECLNWAFPDSTSFQTVQCACLACGEHGKPQSNYADAVEAWLRGEVERATA